MRLHYIYIRHMSLLQKALVAKQDKSVSLAPRAKKDANELLQTIENIYHIKDLDTLLENILLEARRFVNCDAGTIYLSAGGRLYFSYVQNDTLFVKESNRNKYLSGSNSLPINRSSIAGYVALTGESLLIDDVYDIMSSVSYSFNPAFDKKSCYRTQSLLVVPLMTRDDSILGVLQLINAKDHEDRVVPFSMQDRLYISQFAQSAANAIEKAKLSREMVLRLAEMVELRDPYETGPHVKRVGAYSVEIYEAWAKKRNISTKEMTDKKDQLRTAAILHDLGKVAISDTILRKPGPLTEKERREIQMHTIYGARLFHRSNSVWDEVALDVALGHHEHWAGTGYPGRVDNLFAKSITFGNGKKGDEIPLSARLVSIADTFDALVSKRSYKDAWADKEAYEFIASRSGTWFDPELVKIFIGIQDVINAIRRKYWDEGTPPAPEDVNERVIRG